MIYLYQRSFSLVVNYHVYCKLAATRTHLPQMSYVRVLTRFRSLYISVRQLSDTLLSDIL